jgi:hypothetical protein
VLGGAVVTELSSAGRKSQTYVYAGGALLAAQTGGGVVWRQQAPLDMTEWDTDSSGNVLARAELDPEGADFGTSAPSQGEEEPPQPMQSRFGDPMATSSYTIDGMTASQLEIGILLFAVEARSGLPSAVGGSLSGKVKVVGSQWMSKWVDSSDRGSDDPTGTIESGLSWDGGTVTTTDEGFYIEQGGDILEDSVGQQNPTEHATDACGDMAEVAQIEADDVLNTLSSGARAGVQSAAMRRELDNAVLKFDDAFSERYAGHPMRTLDDIIDFYQHNVTRRTIPEFYWGQTGFKKIYMETKPGTETIVDDPTDQTHHFAAMFSGGINGARWSTTAHDMFDNSGDRRLSDAAYTLGEKLRNDPYNTLKHIGDIIRETICDPSTRGRSLDGTPSGAS